MEHQNIKIYYNIRTARNGLAIIKTTTRTETHITQEITKAITAIQPNKRK
jgi:hypothetical protein